MSTETDLRQSVVTGQRLRLREKSKMAKEDKEDDGREVKVTEKSRLPTTKTGWNRMKYLSSTTMMISIMIVKTKNTFTK